MVGLGMAEISNKDRDLSFWKPAGFENDIFFISTCIPPYLTLVFDFHKIRCVKLPLSYTLRRWNSIHKAAVLSL